MSLFKQIKGSSNWMNPYQNLVGGGKAQEKMLTQASGQMQRGYQSAMERYGTMGAGMTQLGEMSIEDLKRLREDPSYIQEMGAYKFRMGQGTSAIEGGAAAKGGLFSGQTLKDLMSFGQELASTEYEKEYARLLGTVQEARGMAGDLGQLDIGKGEAAALPALGMSQWLAGHEAKGREIAGSWGMAGTWMGG